MKSKLYLIPTPLGEYPPSDILPAPVLERIGQLRLFFVEELRTAAYEKMLTTPTKVRSGLMDILTGILDVGDPELNLGTKPAVILVIGVNGVGKTTTIGKLANQLAGEGKRVLLCAADTFRAAAADQLEIWANRADVEIIRQHEGADPASVTRTARRAQKNLELTTDASPIATSTAVSRKSQNLRNARARLAELVKSGSRFRPGFST